MSGALMRSGGGAQVKLKNVVHAGNALTLVFEHLDLDLKQHMDATPGFRSNLALVKVALANGPSPVAAAAAAQPHPGLQDAADA